MIFRHYQKASQLMQAVRHFLMEDEALNNLPLGIMARCIYQEENAAINESNPFFACIMDKDEYPVLVLIMTPPFNLGVFGDRNNPKVNSAITLAIEEIQQLNIRLPGVIGTTQIAGEFAEEWCDSSDLNYETAMEQCIYKLTEVVKITKSPGYLRLANMEDIYLLSQWGYEFSQVTESPFTIEKAVEKTKEFILQESLYVWEDEKPVSMARKARGTENGMSVNYVYTPKQYTRKGYATTCVAELSRLILNDGYKFCTLYTDLSNPTSNSIYQKIGYQPIGDSVVYRFINDKQVT